MKRNQNTINVLLLITAGILTAMLIWTLQPAGEPAYAESSVRGGNYVFGTGAWSSSQDLLYVINRASKQLNVYSLDTNRKRVELEDTQDLTKAFRSSNRTPAR